MKYCFGTVSWGGYLERYIDIFVTNYTILYRSLISVGINHGDIADPKIVYCNDVLGHNVENAREKLTYTTGKDLILVKEEHEWTTEEIMYSTRNRLRTEFRNSFPEENKVYFYFPIDDKIRPCIKDELIHLAKQTNPTACMFKFYVKQPNNNFTAATRPINTYKDIHPGDWGGYCAYNILDEDKCPLYPEIAIPNIAFYVELYKAGYKQYQSKENCIEHLRHTDSHHFKYKDSEMSQKVNEYLLTQRELLAEKGYE